MSTLGGLAAVGEGGVALWNRWYNKKRQQIFQQRLIEKRQVHSSPASSLFVLEHSLGCALSFVFVCVCVRVRHQTLLRQRAQAAQSELEHIDQQLETIAYHLNAQKEKEEV
jgi:hypothetical protein